MFACADPASRTNSGWLLRVSLVVNMVLGVAGLASSFPTSPSDSDLISEWQNPDMGMCFTMVSKQGWRSGRWGVTQRLPKFTDYLQTFISCMTSEQPMGVYQERSFGLAMRIAEESDFWKHFQVIGDGSREGQIVGGAWDGASGVPLSEHFCLPIESQGKNYTWFTEQKNAILANYNTFYGNDDYNEFVVNGLLSTAIAGVIHNERGNRDTPTDFEMCSFLRKNAHWRRTRWPVYSYSRKNHQSQLVISRYLNCPIR